MKKILGLSLLAASLVSTSAFAGNNKLQAAQALIDGQSTVAIPLLVSAVSEFRSENSRNVKAIAINFDPRNDVSLMTVTFAKALTTPDHDTLQQIIMANAKNDSHGCKVLAATGPSIATLTCYKDNAGHKKMVAYSVTQTKNIVTIQKVEAAAGQQSRGFGNNS